MYQLVATSKQLAVGDAKFGLQRGQLLTIFFGQLVTDNYLSRPCDCPYNWLDTQL